MREGKRSIVGYFATGVPLLSTILILAIIVVIVVNFAIKGAPNLTWEFITAAPEKSNSEGGIYPAIIGTVYLVLIMTVAAVPIGAITAVYLTEYARQRSILARTIRFAVNTLAGVPSVVFGLFGLGFFVQTIGGQIDEAKWHTRMNVLDETLQISTSPLAGNRVATIGDVIRYLDGVQDDDWSEETMKLKSYPHPAGLQARTDAPHVVKYLSQKPDLNWGRPSLIWAALTLALLTLPVVIVSVEESLKTVPRDIREASLALGATKLETIWKVVVPNSMTGILTGSILAIARGAGEVAPILFTGVVYSAQQPPTALNDTFMHLGYHLYILSTQSTNVEATRPLQYATTIVLLGLTLALNLAGIFLRARLRNKRLG